MDTKLKNTKSKSVSYIIYLLIIVVTSVMILSLKEVKDNYRYFLPNANYSGELEYEVSNFATKVLELSTYYKDEAYIKDKNNITEEERESARVEITSKIEDEVNEFTNTKYNQESFYNLDYESQEKILEEERKKIEAKYEFDEAGFENYIINEKVNKYKELKNELAKYSNLTYAAYDTTSNQLISGAIPYDDYIKTNSNYLLVREVDSNGSIIDKKYINGKELKNIDRIYKRFNFFNFTRSYTDVSTANVEYKYNEGINNENIKLYVWVPQNLVSGDNIYNIFQGYYESINRFIITAIFLAISVIALCVLVTIVKKLKCKLEIDNKIITKLKSYPIEYKVAVLIIGTYIWNNSVYSIYYGVYNNRYLMSLNFTNIIFTMVILVIWYLVGKILLIDYKEGALFNNSITPKLLNEFNAAAQKGSLFRTIVFMIGGYIVAGLGLLFIGSVFWGLFPICFGIGIIMTIALVILVIKKLNYLSKIMKGAQDAAEGRLTYKIDEKGKGHFRDLAHNINNIKDGLKESIENEMKSERMKTELITNVSHDLKTPLTSIINYIDLLKREELQPEAAKDYVNILDNKSQRLKVLIEDLFEASKAASGAMELNVERIDIIQLLMQALGENDEKLTERKLEVKSNIPPTKIFVNADGKRLYRVFENLIINISKYSMQNTRVYIDMVKYDDEVKIIMKNISAYELNFDVDEITERFKRGDEARSTDGSGLGLAISKSIISLHGGSFDVEIDGDLFKAIITLKL